MRGHHKLASAADAHTLNVMFKSCNNLSLTNGKVHNIIAAKDGTSVKRHRISDFHLVSASCLRSGSWTLIVYHSFCKIGFAPSQEFCRMVDKKGASRWSAPLQAEGDACSTSCSASLRPGHFMLERAGVNRATARLGRRVESLARAPFG